MSSNTIQSKKKKKGPAPAHQNKFAFYHNPKSKKTAHILESKISNVCHKCREKLEWRKKYRKYKPLTQPSICNICRNRNITAAYHTICYNCSRQSDKARSILSEKQQQQQHCNGKQPSKIDTICDLGSSAICAMCVQEPAILENGDDDHEKYDGLWHGEESLSGSSLSLRQKKSLLRKQQQQQQRKSNRTTENDEKETDSKSEQYDSENDADDDEGNMGRTHQDEGSQESLGEEDEHGGFNDDQANRNDDDDDYWSEMPTENNYFEK
jgi:hypothetical protein